MRYILREHVQACCVQNHVILLDLKKDRYLGLNRPSVRLADLIEGWPRSNASAECTQSDDELLSPFLAADLITERTVGTSRPPAARVARPELGLQDEYELDAKPISALDLVRFIRAALCAMTLLKMMPLEKVVRRTHQRRLRRPAANYGIDELRRCVNTFSRLRPLMAASSTPCMQHSLALSEFLALYGFFPEWVFGVTAAPFSAHCWLQHESVVLNDTAGNVSRYAPILVL